MTFSTVLDTAQIEETKRLIAEHTAIIMGNITADNTTYNAVQRIIVRAKPANDPDVAVAGLKSYFSDRFGACLEQKLNFHSITLSFLQTGLNLVDWYAVLSYMAELESSLDNHPF